MCLSCKNTLVYNLTQKKVLLIDDKNNNLSFAEMKILVPNNLDTLLIWKDFSDHTYSSKQKYRFVNRNSCLKQETGMYRRHKRLCKDYVNQITIEHQYVNNPRRCVELYPKAFDKYKHLNKLYKENMYELIEQDLKTINNRQFVLIKYYHLLHWIDDKSVFNKTELKRIIYEAHTIVNNTFIILKIEKSIPNNEIIEIIENEYEILNSIKIIEK